MPKGPCLRSKGQVYICPCLNMKCHLYHQAKLILWDAPRNSSAPKCRW